MKDQRSKTRDQRLPWWHDGVIYQIYPRSFADSNGDGIGDLPGLISKLDYLQWLGVDAVWLSPIFPSPMADFGYDVSNYHDIDPIFGTLGDFDRFLYEAHQRGIHVVLDMVMNHTSDQHPWFIESRSSRHNPRHDWYIWRDPQDGHEPNNWESVFGGNAWMIDTQIGRYYLHLFTPEQPDLNWRNLQVKEAMFKECAFWLDRGVDGFRLDVAHMLVKAEGLPDNPRRPGLHAYARQDHSSQMNQPETHAIWKEFRQLLNAYPNRMAVGEVDPIGAAEYYGNGQDELHLVFIFALLHQGWRARNFHDVVAGWEAALPDQAWPCWVLNNHDNKRSISRYASGSATEARARLAATMLLTLRGTPFLYYGEEIGARDVDVPADESVDPPASVGDPGFRWWDRSRCRTPMAWSSGSGAGFTTGRPWLRLAGDAERLQAGTEAVRAPRRAAPSAGLRGARDVRDAGQRARLGGRRHIERDDEALGCWDGRWLRHGLPV